MNLPNGLVSFQCTNFECSFNKFHPNRQGFAMKPDAVLQLTDVVKCPNCQSNMICEEAEEMLEELKLEMEVRLINKTHFDAFEKYLRGGQ